MLQGASLYPYQWHLFVATRGLPSGLSGLPREENRCTAGAMMQCAQDLVSVSGPLMMPPLRKLAMSMTRSRLSLGSRGRGSNMERGVNKERSGKIIK